MFNSNHRKLVSTFSLAALILSMSSPIQAQSTSSIMSPGAAAVTAFSGVINQANGISIDTNGPSVRIIQLPTSTPYGLRSAQKTFTVTAASVGQVFGITLDNAAQPNIFVAATSAYGLAISQPNAASLQQGAPGAQFIPGLFGPTDSAGGPESIWRIDGQSGAVTLFANVSFNGIGNAPAGLGALAFDPTSQQIFVSDRATGMIHRLTLDGTDLNVYDHGVTGLTAVGQQPVPFDSSTVANIQNSAFHPDDPNTWGYAPEPRRVFALAVHSHRLYYSVSGSQIFSVGIAANGTFANDARYELNVPALSPGNEISSIDFDNAGYMYIAERGAPTGDATFVNVANGGQNRVKRFAPKTPNDSSADLWTSPGDEYATGMPPSYQNADGGVALNCARVVWATGERMLDTVNAPDNSFPHIDGLQGTKSSLVEPANMPPTQSWYINYYNTQANPDSRGHMGADVILKICGGYVTPAVQVEVPPPVLVQVPPVEIGFSCPAGTFLVDGDCLLPPVCPQGTFFRDGNCIYQGCPGGFVRFSHHNECVRPPQVCRFGTVFFDGRCVPVGCPPRFSRDARGFCHCPMGQGYLDGRCSPRPHCKPNEMLMGNHCAPKTCRNGIIRNGTCIPSTIIPVCKKNEVVRANKCVPTLTPPVVCRAGQTSVNGVCKTVTCRLGQTNVNGVCKTTTCTKGQMIVNGVCVAKRTPVTTCLTGQIVRGNHCVTVNKIVTSNKIIKTTPVKTKITTVKTKTTTTTSTVNQHAHAHTQTQTRTTIVHTHVTVQKPRQVQQPHTAVPLPEKKTKGLSKRPVSS